MNNKKTLRHILTALGLMIAAGLTVPFFGVGENVIESYRSPSHWLVTALIVAVIYPITLYFSEWNQCL